MEAVSPWPVFVVLFRFEVCLRSWHLGFLLCRFLLHAIWRGPFPLCCALTSTLRPKNTASQTRPRPAFLHTPPPTAALAAPGFGGSPSARTTLAPTEAGGPTTPASRRRSAIRSPSPRRRRSPDRVAERCAGRRRAGEGSARGRESGGGAGCESERRSTGCWKKDGKRGHVGFVWCSQGMKRHEEVT